MDMAKEEAGERPVTRTTEAGLNIRWDDANMRSSYANVVNVTGSREEITLLFGIHKAWHSEVKEVTVQLLDRVILSPYAAKRLNLLLTQVLREYESRYGVLPIEASSPVGPGGSLPTR
jgi:hypothetical protein